ncbi:MAG: thioredoxin family protein [Fuerstiella sp.]|nr:thioredoxin family protein [Fuerstiella sp.]
MRRIRSLVYIVALIISESVLADPGWLATFGEAEQIASEQKVPLLVHFHASWCGPCRQMDKYVFSSSVVQRALREGLSAVKVDITKRPDLKARFSVASIPRDVVLHPDGTFETLSVGMVPKATYLSLLRDAAARGRVIAMTLMEDSDSDEIGAVVHNFEAVPPLSNASADEEIIGLSGYCPVMLTGKKRWIRGKQTFAERYRGVVYYFSDMSQRDVFLRNPDRYAPRNLGCDPVILLRENRTVTGRIRYGVFFEGNLYLCRSEETLSEFRRHPRRYTRIQHAVRPSELTGQTFR